MQANRWGSEHQQRSVDTLVGRSMVETQHDIFRWCVLNRDIIVARPPEVYRVTKLPTIGLYFCLVAQCGGQSGTRFNLHRQFLM